LVGCGVEDPQAAKVISKRSERTKIRGMNILRIVTVKVFVSNQDCYTLCVVMFLRFAFLQMLILKPGR